MSVCLFVCSPTPPRSLGRSSPNLEGRWRAAPDISLRGSFFERSRSSRSKVKFMCIVLIGRGGFVLLWSSCFSCWALPVCWLCSVIPCIILSVPLGVFGSGVNLAIVKTINMFIFDFPFF